MRTSITNLPATTRKSASPLFAWSPVGSPYFFLPFAMSNTLKVLFVSLSLLPSVAMASPADISPYGAWTRTSYPANSERHLRAQRKVLRQQFSHPILQATNAQQSTPIVGPALRKKPATTCGLVLPATARKGSRGGLFSC